MEQWDIARLRKLKRKVVNPTRFQKQSMHVSRSRMSPRDNVWNHLNRKMMKTTSQAKDTTRWPITIWFTSFFLCLKRWRFWMRKQHWRRNGRNLRRFQPGSWRKSKARRSLFWKHTETKRKSTLLRWWTSVISNMQSWNQNFRSVKAESCSEETLWWTTLDPVQSLLNKARLRLKHSCKIYGCLCGTTWQWWTSSWRGIGVHSGNDGGCIQIAQNPKVRMSGYMDTPSTTSMANVVVKHWRYSGSSWKTIIRTLTCWPLVGKTVRSSIGTRMGKSTELGMFFHRKQGLFLLVCVDDMTGKM